MRLALLPGVEIIDEATMILRPPRRAYGSSTQTRELVWERVWRAADGPPAQAGG
jgi:hypothetical protein